MKPLFALLVFMGCMLGVYHLPTPDPSLQDENISQIDEIQPAPFDQAIEFVQSPLEINIP